MKRIIVLLVIVCFSACQKQKYTTESLLLENLKESSTYFKSECHDFKPALEIMYSDRGRESGKFDTLNLIAANLDKLYKEIKSENDTQKLTLYRKVINTINDYKSEYKIDNVDPEKTQLLSGELLYFYLKSRSYQNLLEHYADHNGKMGIFCGTHLYSPHQQELIDIIRDSDIE